MTFEGLFFWYMPASPQCSTPSTLDLFFIPVHKLQQGRSNLFNTEQHLAACLRVSKVNGEKQERCRAHLCSYINLNLFSQALGNAVQLSYFHQQPTDCRCCDFFFSFSKPSQASGDSPIHLHCQPFFFFCLLPKGGGGGKIC